MKPLIEFTTDRNKVTEGDIVEVRWGCPGAAEVSLTIDNGYKKTDIPLEISGYKKFRLNRSKGRTVLTLNATIQGHPYKQKLYVRVKPMKTTKAETLGTDGKKQTAIKRWWLKLKEQCRRDRAKFKQLPPQKQFAYKLMIILPLVFLMPIFTPKIYPIGAGLAIFYILLIILKR